MIRGDEPVVAAQRSHRLGRRGLVVHPDPGDRASARCPPESIRPAAAPAAPPPSRYAGYGGLSASMKTASTLSSARAASVLRASPTVTVTRSATPACRKWVAGHRRPLRIEFQRLQLAVGGQTTGDPDGRVAGAGADLQHTPRADQAAQQLQHPPGFRRNRRYTPAPAPSPRWRAARPPPPRPARVGSESRPHRDMSCSPPLVVRCRRAPPGAGLTSLEK